MTTRIKALILLAIVVVITAFIPPTTNITDGICAILVTDVICAILVGCIFGIMFMLGPWIVKKTDKLK